MSLKQFSSMLFGTAPARIAGNDELSLSVAVIFIGIVAASYTSYLFFAQLNAALAEPVQVIHVVQTEPRHGEYRVRGYVTMPTECDEVSVQTKQITKNEFELMVSTWQEPSRLCPPRPTARLFESVIFASVDDIHILISIDGRRAPVTIEYR